MRLSLLRVWPKAVSPQWRHPFIKAHSFAHLPEDNVFDCVSSGESALHQRAKEIIAITARITLPATSVPGLDDKLVEVSPEPSIVLTDVRLEVVEGEVVPDVMVTMSDGRRIFMEIANTHPCPPPKLEKLDLMGVEVLEIQVAIARGSNSSHGSALE